MLIEQQSRWDPSKERQKAATKSSAPMRTLSSVGPVGGVQCESAHKRVPGATSTAEHHMQPPPLFQACAGLAKCNPIEHVPFKIPGERGTFSPTLILVLSESHDVPVISTCNLLA